MRPFKRLVSTLLAACLCAAVSPPPALAYFVFSEETEAADPVGLMDPVATDATVAMAVATEAPAAADPNAPAQAVAEPDDGTFWTMRHGEMDDAAVWAVLMQPITVYDGGIDQREHVYLMENPDGSGTKIAQIHAQSQGIRVLSEPNEHGYVLAQVYSNYDDKYTPKTEEEIAHAYERKEGYLKASGLKEIQVQQDIALVVDKQAQRLYIYIDGVRVDELLVSTGLVTKGDYYKETPPGEYITVSHVGPFSTHRYMKSEMAIRINGGILIHEVPYEPLGDGSRRYRDFEAKLGTKASAGCIRVQREETDKGYNQKWIWENLKRATPYKVIIWENR